MSLILAVCLPSLLHICQGDLLSRFASDSAHETDGLAVLTRIDNSGLVSVALAIDKDFFADPHLAVELPRVSLVRNGLLANRRFSFRDRIDDFHIVLLLEWLIFSFDWLLLRSSFFGIRGLGIIRLHFGGWLR